MHSTAVLVGPTLPHARIRMHASTVGWIALMVMIISGSTGPAFAKQLTAFFSPLSMLVISEIMQLLFCVLSFGFLPIVRKTLQLKRTILLPLVTAGVINGILAPICAFTGLAWTSSVNAQLFGNAETLFLLIFGMLLLHQTPRRIHFLGGFIVTCGLLFVALKGFSEHLSPSSGDLLIILASVFYGLGGTLVRKYLHGVEPQIIMVVRALAAMSFFFVLSPFISHPFITEIKSFPWEFLIVLLSYGLISRFLLVFTYYESIERLPLPTVSLLSTLTVGTATIFSYLYLGETIAWYHIIGAALIILGAGVVEWHNITKLEERVVHFLKSHRRQI